MNAMNSSDPAAESALGSGTPHSAAIDSTGKATVDGPQAMSRDALDNRLATLATILSSLLIAVPVAASRIAEGILDQTNPDGLKDLSNGLAYLGPILGWSYGALGLLLVVLIAVMVALYRRARTLRALKLPLIVVALQLVFGALALTFGALAQ
ncbi:MAG: hypothetical protein ABI137_00390 [Antricoccus sp.]